MEMGRTELLPLTVSSDAPGPVTVIEAFIAGKALARVMVFAVAKKVGSKKIVAPEVALALVIAARRDPAPESLLLVTTKLGAGVVKVDAGVV